MTTYTPEDVTLFEKQGLEKPCFHSALSVNKKTICSRVSFEKKI